MSKLVLSRHLRTLFSLLAWCLLGAVAPASAQRIPSQYIAKLYTEVLGRVPDAEALGPRQNYFAQFGCNPATLREQGLSVYLSPEYQGLGYSNSAKVLTLYRGILSRDPDPAGFRSFRDALNAGTPLTQVLNTFYNSFEFQQLLVPLICGANSSYAWGPTPATRIDPVPGNIQTADYVQEMLFYAQWADDPVVVLPRRAVYVLNKQLWIPPGVTLMTEGLPGPNRYAEMARFVRGPAFPETSNPSIPASDPDRCAKAPPPPMVLVQADAALASVWVDGQRSSKTICGFVAVFTEGGSATRVVNSRISDSAGPATLQLSGRANGPFPGHVCHGTLASGNLITGYAGGADGIGVNCENATVTHNQLMDIQDAPIVIFRGVDVPQTSQVRFNVIMSMGAPVNYGIVVDPFVIDVNSYPDGRKASLDFRGLAVDQNVILSGPRGVFRFGLLVGTRALFGLRANTGKGASVTNNSLSGVFNTAIGVSGMTETTVSGNTVSGSYAQATRSCPPGPLGVGTFTGHVQLVNGSGGAFLPDGCF